MSAVEVPRLLPSAPYKWWGAPFDLGRLPYYASSRPFWRGPFACFELLEHLLGPAIWLALQSRLLTSAAAVALHGAADRRLATLVETAVLATQRGLPHPDLETVVQDYVGELPASAPRPALDAAQTQAGWNAHALVPHGVSPGMVFAAGTRAPWGARNASLRISRGFTPVRPQVRGPSEGLRPGRFPVGNEKSSGNQLVYRPGG